jgi:hypothetical protein
LSFLEISTEFSTIPSSEDLRFTPSLRLDGNHQGAMIAQETTRDEYLSMQKFIPMWHVPEMVSHMMPTSAHEYIYY